ncbi:hypothetical protein SAMN04489860_2102 [Paraoerskovia marina]|uniref:Peptide chain release factor 1 (ERF1) n=1 Tax=Paraoerskovia marina TaxID=545619 RepID=A0A1H1U6H6_9CELL|nr:hypothetical protein [Paraoerskovia marina]SDS68014.1 hypothetical protein SAMN04489860_2102 [Paraoerskovia marina]
MKIDWLKPLLGSTGPFATATLDVSRGGESGERELRARWRSVVRDLDKAGAPAAVVADLEDRALRPTHVHGPHGRVIIATAEDGVLVDRILAAPPTASRGHWGAAPELGPAARAADESVNYLLVVADRTGADLYRSTPGTGGIEVERSSVEGDHDAVTKAKVGRYEEKRVEGRAEDSWERNAEAIAARVDRIVAEHGPEVVLLSGDVRACALVRGAATRKTGDLLVDVQGGARDNGVNQASFDAHIAEALAKVRERRRTSVFEELQAAVARDAGGVTSLADAVTVLQRGQVRELVITASALDGDTNSLWVGPDLLHLASSKEEVEALGVAPDDVRELPATVAVMRAALGQDAGVTVVGHDLPGGVGALLRWADEDTPHDASPSMSGDAERLRPAS